MTSRAVHNFHVPLQEELYEELRAQAKRLMRPATELVRQALEQWLEQQRKAALREAIAAYAAEHAGTAMDLDPELEAAGIESLLQEDAGW